MRNRIFDSFNARIIQPWTTKHYALTAPGHRIKKMKNAYAGKRCFFVGNGPSLQASDLTCLHDHNEITFAFNRVYNIFEQTAWRPSFYISQDEKMLKGCEDVVDKLDIPVKLIPIQLKWWYDIKIHDALYFNMSYQPLDNPMDTLLWSDDVASEIYCASTGMFSAAQFAAYMGFSEIYLIGVDHHFRVSQNNKGEVVIDKNVKDYFSENYNSDKDKLYIPNTEKSTYTYIAMKAYCDNRSIRIYNATRGGKLEVFPRIEFETLF